MRYFLRIVIITSIAFTYTHHTDVNLPPQKVCNSLRACLKPANLSRSQQGGSWRVARVTRLPNSQDHRFNPNENFCSVAHYGSDCGAIFYTKTVNDDGVVIATALTYDKRTQTILRYRKELFSQDPNYCISKGTLTKMERIGADKKITPVRSIPDSVKEDHAAMYAVVAVAPNGGKWSISRTCDQKIAWVLFPNDIPAGLEEEYRRTYEKEIDVKLDELHIDRTTLVNVPLNLPFQPPTSKETADSDLSTDLSNVQKEMAADGELGKRDSDMSPPENEASCSAQESLPKSRGIEAGVHDDFISGDSLQAMRSTNNEETTMIQKNKVER